MIVVDDASTDDTASVAQRAGARVIRHPHNLGAAAARNTGVSATSQPWIAPLDSDDRWTQHLLSSLWPMRDGYGFVAGASMAVDGDDSPLAYGGTMTRAPLILDSPAPLVFPENFVAASGVIVRRDTFLQAGGYRAVERQAEDFDLWLRMLELRPGLCLPRVVTLYRVHPDGKGQHSGTAALEIVEQYHDRPWYSPRLVEQRRAVLGWDEMRAALAAFRLREAVAKAVWLSRRRARREAVVRTLSRRRQARARAAEWIA